MVTQASDQSLKAEKLLQAPQGQDLGDLLETLKSQGAPEAGSSLEALSPQKTFSLTIAESWQQGRTVFGGLIGALAVRAARSVAGHDRPLRNIMANFSAPNGSALSLEAEMLRSGRSATFSSVRFRSGGAHTAQFSAVFAAERETISVPPPAYNDFPLRDNFPSMPRGVGPLPAFLSQMELKWLGDGIPMSGQADRQLRLFVRFDGKGGDLSAEERIVLLADVPPPIILSHSKEWAPASSMTWSLDFIEPVRHVSEWLYLDYRLVAAVGGYVQQAGSIYDETGKLLALSHQCMTFFPPQR